MPQLTLTSTIHNNPKGISLIDYLCLRFPYKNKAAWLEAIEAGQVAINGQHPTPEQSLKIKDSISYTAERTEPTVATDIQTIFEDEYLMVVSKPAPLPVHAQGVFILNTLIYMLREQTGNQDLSLGHRLDRETSGLMILAKNRGVTAKLMARFEESTVKKQYLAVVRGEVDFEKKFIQGWMGRKPGSQIRMRRELISEAKEDYQDSSTDFTLQQKLKGYSLIACEPISGRTNQIRIHLDSIGHSIVGDKLYGHTDEEYIAYLRHIEKRGDLAQGGTWDHPRHLLHAWKLSMNHPITNQPMSWEAPIAQDMQTFINLHSNS